MCDGLLGFFGFFSCLCCMGVGMGFGWFILLQRAEEGGCGGLDGGTGELGLWGWCHVVSYSAVRYGAVQYETSDTARART